jgi:eukaryotic-like serine/threonine-protein kinase
VVAKVYGVETGSLLSRPTRYHEEAVFDAAFSPDGGRIVTGSIDRTARVWDALGGAPRAPPMVHRGGTRTVYVGGAVSHCEFSPDGRRVLTACQNGAAHVWDAAAGVPALPPMRHGAGVEYATYSPDGRWIVTASGDDTARAWDAATGAAVTPPLRHDGPVAHAAFRPDGRRVVTAGWDGAAKVWDVSPDPRPLEELRRLAGVLSYRRVDETGGLVPLDPEEFRAAWRALHTPALP